MITPPALNRFYSDISEDLEVLKTTVEQTVFKFCNDNGYAFNGRIKEVISLAEKLESGRYEKVSDIEDFYGCSIILPSLNDEQFAVEFLQRAFVETDIIRRGSSIKPPEVFRFDATRFKGRLRYSGGDPKSQIHKINFEVQIRSAFEHAWQVTTHALSYKSAKVDWKLTRVAAQLKASVEQLDTIVQAFDANASVVSEHPYYDTNCRKLIISSFKPLFLDKAIPSEFEPKDWSRFAENMTRMISANYKRGREDYDVYFPRIVSEIIVKIKSMAPEFIPKSLSLFQFVFGISAEGNIIKPELRNFKPLVTDELIQFFPATKHFKSSCGIDRLN